MSTDEGSNTHTPQETDDGGPPVVSLASVSEKQLPAKCKPETLTYCPSMDLVALATEDEQVHVFRLNGQKVFGGFARGGGDGLKVTALRWKGSGHYLSVATSDNTIRFLSAATGRTVHVLSCKPVLEEGFAAWPREPVDDPTPSICCLGWGQNVADGVTPLAATRDPQRRISIQEILGTETELLRQSNAIADLPRELALLDIDRSLPKLSTLPSTGNDDDIFSSRSSIDSIFHSNKQSSDLVDVLLAGFDDGTINIRIFDSFEIGSISVCKSFQGCDGARALAHSYASMCSTHAFLFATKSGENERLSLFSLDLLFITKCGRYLSVLASKVTQLQNLLRYIKQVQMQIHLEWKNAQDLPGRYLRNINEDLHEKLNCNFTTAAYHLVVTGDCFDPLKEFLVDQVGERGHKRWEKAITNGYETIRRLTHQNLLPALERCSVLLSRLIGMSKFHKLSPVLGLNTTDLKECLADVECLTLLGHKVMIASGKELSQFIAFSAWLRYEIELQAADPLSATADELTEKADTINRAETLSYIKGPLTRSALLDYISTSPSLGANRWSDTTIEGVLYEDYRNALHKLDDRRPGEEVDVPFLSDLTARFEVQLEKVFKRVAETQRRSILDTQIQALGADAGSDVVDLTVKTSNQGSVMTIYLASRSKTHPCIIYFVSTVLKSINGVSTMVKSSVATVSLREGEIRDAKFVEDGNIMLLWHDGDISGTAHLVSFSYAVEKTGLFSPEYREGYIPEQTSPDDQPTSPDIFGEHSYILTHTFQHRSNAEPLRIDVNGRQGRRAVCVLYSDRQWYSVFDMDSFDEGFSEQAEEGIDEGSETLNEEEEEEEHDENAMLQ